MSENTTALFLTCAYSGIVKVRGVFQSEQEEAMKYGIGWSPQYFLQTLQGTNPENSWKRVDQLSLFADRQSQWILPSLTGNQSIANLCDVYFEDAPWEGCPRTFLKQIVELATFKNIEAIVATEHKFSIMSQKQSSHLSDDCFVDSEPFLEELATALQTSGIHAETFLAYDGRQFELTTHPQPLLRAADETLITRLIVRRVAKKMGYQASFSSCDKLTNNAHLHWSLRNLEGESLTYDTVKDEEEECLISSVAQCFASGIVRYMRELCIFSQPAYVSYLQHLHSASAYTCLGDNRNASLRIYLPTQTKHRQKECHLEYRPSDACSNPYLAFGAILMAGLEGVNEQLDCPPLIQDDPNCFEPLRREAMGVLPLPISLEEALQKLKDSHFQNIFPDPLLQAYCNHKQLEIAETQQLDNEQIYHLYRLHY